MAPQHDPQLGAALQLKTKAAFKFIALSGKRHWCKSQKAGRIKRAEKSGKKKKQNEISFLQSWQRRRCRQMGEASALLAEHFNAALCTPTSICWGCERLVMNVNPQLCCAGLSLRHREPWQEQRTRIAPLGPLLCNSRIFSMHQCTKQPAD